MKKFLKFIFALAIVLIIIYPKPAGLEGGALPLPENEYSWVEKDVSCFGYKFNPYPDEMDAPDAFLCAGIPFGAECTEFTYNKKTGKRTREEIVCKW